MSTKLRLHVLEINVLDFIHLLNNESVIMSFLFEETYRSMTSLQNDYDKNIDSDTARQFILKKNDEKVGFVSLFGFEPVHQKAEFGIMIEKKHQGNGYASKATKLAMEYAFMNMNVRKLSLVVDETNEKAIYVYRKVGFEDEAVLKDEYFVSGSYHNVLLMSIFREDYKKL